jgi:DNA-binding XRE family transcriptional regulator
MTGASMTSSEQTDQVRLRVAAGASKASVAREMGVSPKTISNIINRECYRGINPCSS